MEIKTRCIEESDIHLLPSLLYDAIFIPEGVERPQEDIINRPELSCYFEAFGESGDYCLIAEFDNEVVGACWVRLFKGIQKGYGYINDDIPELCMSVFPVFRNKGIGTKLFTQMLADLKIQGYAEVSLSVDKANYAYRMYMRFGFSIHHEDDKSATMIKSLP